ALQTGAQDVLVRWEKEKEYVAKVVECRVAFDEARKADIPEAKGLGEKLATAIRELDALQGDDALIHYEVTPEVVARVIADWTGIPLGSVQRDQAASLLGFNAQMKNWVIGQDHA